MNLRAAPACLLVLFSPLAMAGERSQPAAASVEPVAVRAKLDALRGEEKNEDAEVRQLRARVDTLESDSQAANRDLEERDRKIAELQRQLEASQGQ
jgi:peptidoglycan hydrolase CwlO-like protein